MLEATVFQQDYTVAATFKTERNGERERKYLLDIDTR